MAHAPIQITLADEDAIEFVRSKVQSGEYASEADVLRDGILVLQEEATELERWIKEVVLPRCASYDADPSTAISLEELEKNLAERRRQRVAVSA
jgi:antitoxin ParD1/3/4